MHLGRRSRGFDRSEGLQDAVGVLGTRRNHPGIARLQSNCLPLDLQLGPSGDDVADHLILVLVRGLVLGRLLVRQSRIETRLPEAR